MSETTLAVGRDLQRTGLADALSRKFWSLETGKLCAAARRRAGLDDFGEPPLEPALSILADSLETQANLHPLGRFLMRVHLTDLLAARLRLAQYWRGKTEALSAEPIERPIFITGMPRSGSTFLHELLAEDPASRAPRVWEVMFPVPISKQPSGPDPRIKKAAACLWWFRRFAPEADAVFPMRARTPHECVAIHSYSFLSEEFISTCHVPSYEAFLRHADLRPAYAWQRRFLQHLQSGGAPRRWVLKSPDHVYGLEALFAVFPDALIIQTHRNPLDVLKSSCHLTEVLQGLYGRPAPDGELAARESKVLAAAVNRFISFRDAHPELASRFIDVTYDEIVSHPLAVIRSIYERFELPLSDAAADRIQRAAQGRARYANRQPAAARKDFKLETIADASCFERYCLRFKIGWQQPRTQ